MDDDVKENYIVSSLVRGFTILTTFTVNKPALKVSEIAEITGLDQATVFRFVYTLEKMGYLVRDEDTKRYRQSVRMLTLSLPAREGIAVREVAMSTLFELSKMINETVDLALLDGVEVVTISVSEIVEKLIYRNPIGHRLPAYCTSTGKVLLAFQTIETWDQLISRIEFVPRTERTIIDPKFFREELLKIRQQGYAIQDSELIVGFGGIAAPILDHRGVVTTALNISGLSMQILQKEKLEFNITELLKSAQTISAKLGFIHGNFQSGSYPYTFSDL